MLQDELDAHRRMRTCLRAIADLDPPGVAARLTEVDGIIARLEARLAERASEAASGSHPRGIEVVTIGVRAA